MIDRQRVESRGILGLSNVGRCFYTALKPVYLKVAAPPSILSVSSMLAEAGPWNFNWPTTNLKEKEKDFDFMSTGPARNRTTHRNIDFEINVRDKPELTSKSAHEFLNSNSSPLPECQVVLNDVFSSNPAEKLKLLKFNQDNHHSVSSQQALENHYREQLNRKDPIAWPSMNNDSEWESLDNAVGNILLTAKMSTILD